MDFGYLKGATEHGILFGRVNEAYCEVYGFVNLDFASDLDRRRSITCFYLLCKCVIT